MSLTVQFLSSIRGFLQARDGRKLREWLLVEPPLPEQYEQLAHELKSGYRGGDSLARLVERCLPEEDDVPDDRGTAWPGFVSFVQDYLEYWRDVNFEDLLGAHQLLTGLTSSCTTALNNPTYGTIMLQTSISLCGSLSKLSMTLNKRPDLTRKLQTVDTGDEEQKSIVETTAEGIQKVFTACLTDRSSQRHEVPKGKKVGVYIFANVTLKLLFACRKTHLAKQLFTNITAKAPPLSFYPAAQRVTYLYYLGRFHFINNHFARAAKCLQAAYLQTPPAFEAHRRLVLTYLIPCNLFLGRLPAAALLARPEARSLAPVFLPFVHAVRSGSHLLLRDALAAHETWLFRRGLLLALLFRLKPLVWRSFSRRVFLLTYVAPADADSRKAATLELSHFLAAAVFAQKRLEGYVPSPAPPTAATTLALPPGARPRALRPDEGLVWGNMAVTVDHVEDIVASLIAQGLLHGFLAHAQGRFAVMGAKQKGSAVAAGWPPPAEILTQSEAQDVPGWVER